MKQRAAAAKAAAERAERQKGVKISQGVHGQPARKGLFVEHFSAETRAAPPGAVFVFGARLLGRMQSRGPGAV